MHGVYVMAKMVFLDARVWRYVVSAISKIIEEGVFIADPEEGLRFRAMDPSHVIMLDLWFPVDSFEEYDVGERTEIGVNMADVAKILRRARKDDKLEILSTETKVSFAFVGKGYRKFTLPMLDITAEELPEPRLEFAVEARIMSDVYKDTIKDVELMGDVIRFIAEGNELHVVSESELGEAEVILSTETGSLVELNIGGEDKQASSYSIEYFSELASAATVSNFVVVKFSTDMPIMVDHDLPQGAKFSFLVAPRSD